MDAGLIERIETNVERGASALFGGAVGFAVYEWLSAAVLQPQLGVYTAGAAAIACLLCSRGLNAATKEVQRFAVPVFDVREIEWVESEDELLLTEADRLEREDELLLTDAHRLGPVNELLLTLADRVDPARDEPLVLDDILIEIGPDARVVRLFDRKAMPTPGQLQTRIDSHLGRESSPATPSDASQALSDALAELKRSLR